MTTLRSVLIHELRLALYSLEKPAKEDETVVFEILGVEYEFENSNLDSHIGECNE